MSTILLMHGEVRTARKIDVLDGVDNSSVGRGVDHLEEVGVRKATRHGCPGLTQ